MLLVTTFTVLPSSQTMLVLAWPCYNSKQPCGAQFILVTHITRSAELTVQLMLFVMYKDEVRLLSNLYRSLIINIGLVASCWFISLHAAFHDARSQEPKAHSF